jgi:hypothetical protein
MTLLHEAVDSKRFDVRVIERNVERGLLSPKEVEKSIKDLADDSENAEYVSIESLANDETGSSRTSH